MAPAELNLQFSMTQPQKHPQHDSAVESADAEDSWEVKAFMQDRMAAAAATWPPRSYACSFCRRQFRSAQALGGHMNVHRRDRARLLHQCHANPSPPPHPLALSVRALPCANLNELVPAKHVEEIDLELRLGW